MERSEANRKEVKRRMLWTRSGGRSGVERGRSECL
jgi:hypothetical protein